MGLTGLAAFLEVPGEQVKREKLCGRRRRVPRLAQDLESDWTRQQYSSQLIKYQATKNLGVGVETP